MERGSNQLRDHIDASLKADAAIACMMDTQSSLYVASLEDEDEDGTSCLINAVCINTMPREKYSRRGFERPPSHTSGLTSRTQSSVQRSTEDSGSQLLDITHIVSSRLGEGL